VAQGEPDPRARQSTVIKKKSTKKKKTMLSNDKPETELPIGKKAQAYLRNQSNKVPYDYKTRVGRRTSLKGEFFTQKKKEKGYNVLSKTAQCW